MTDPSYPKGFQPLPRDPDELPWARNDAVHSTLAIGDLPLPTSQLIEQARASLRDELGEQVWDHSHRAFLFATALHKTYLAHAVALDAESFYLACLFHDLGLVEKNVNATKLSFEFYGGILARQWLLEHNAPTDLADAVAEAIFRHTDSCKGRISSTGALIQLGTLFDNIAARVDLLPDALIGQVHEAYPRENWGMCFKCAMEAEIARKPWAHATELAATGDKAWDKILNNALEELARIF